MPTRDRDAGDGRPDPSRRVGGLNYAPPLPIGLAAPAPRRAGRRFWIAYAAAWLVAAVVYLATFVAQGSSWSAALPSVVVNIVAAAILGVPVVRFWTATGAGGFWPRGAALHLLLGAAFSVGWLVAVGLGLSAVTSLRDSVWTSAFLRGAALPWQLLSGLMVYAAIAGASSAARTAGALAAERERALRAEAARVRAELGALHARFQPHFLFNSLHGIAALVRADAVRGAEAIEQLGDLLRVTLRSFREDTDLHELADEWDIVQRYVALERLRLGDRLRVEASLDDDALECLVPPFLLQPLVENAIQHAVAPSRGGATIRVGARVQAGTLRVDVEDDGDADPPPASGAGMGLKLVRDRLAALFPGRSALVTGRARPVGFRAEATLPAVFDGDPEAVSPHPAR